MAQLCDVLFRSGIVGRRDLERYLGAGRDSLQARMQRLSELGLAEEESASLSDFDSIRLTARGLVVLENVLTRTLPKGAAS